jgi:hypothetical protein
MGIYRLRKFSDKSLDPFQIGSDVRYGDTYLTDEAGAFTALNIPGDIKFYGGFSVDQDQALGFAWGSPPATTPRIDFLTIIDTQTHQRRDITLPTSEHIEWLSESPDGQFLAAQLTISNSDIIWVYEVATHRTFMHRIRLDVPARFSHARWVPNSHSLIYDNAGSPLSIVIYTPGQLAASQIDFGTSDYSATIWSPDGQSAAVWRRWASPGQPDQWAIETFRLSNMQKQTIATGSGVDWPEGRPVIEWKPDGQRLIFAGEFTRLSPNLVTANLMAVTFTDTGQPGPVWELARNVNVKASLFYDDGIVFVQVLENRLLRVQSVRLGDDSPQVLVDQTDEVKFLFRAHGDVVGAITRDVAGTRLRLKRQTDGRILDYGPVGDINFGFWSQSLADRMIFEQPMTTSPSNTSNSAVSIIDFNALSIKLLGPGQLTTLNGDMGDGIFALNPDAKQLTLYNNLFTQDSVFPVTNFSGSLINLSPDRNHIIYTSVDSEARTSYWVSTNAKIDYLLGPDIGNQEQVAWSPDSSLLAASSMDPNTIQHSILTILNAETGAIHWERKMPGYTITRLRTVPCTPQSIYTSFYGDAPTF